MAAVLPGAPPSIRGKDRKKVDVEWVDVKRVQEYEDGWYLGYIDHPTDLATLGKLMGHCSGTHFVWACEERIWYFFGLFDKDDVPHGTLHAKEKKWMNKAHPRDSAPLIPTSNRNRRICQVCRGNGGGYNLKNVFTNCDTCKGTGYAPADPDPGNPVVQLVPSSGGYVSFQDVVDAFKKAGIEYEPGKYAPVHYNSRTYEGGAAGDYYGGGARDFEGQYGRADVFGGKKPDGVSEETWAQYTKVFKAIKDEFNKNSGFVKIAGRVFKFDGKDLIVLSWSDKDQYGAGKQEYRKLIADFLNDHTKSKRVTKEAETA